MHPVLFAHVSHALPPSAFVPVLRAFSAFASGEGGGAAATGARSALMQEVKALHMLAPMP